MGAQIIEKHFKGTADHECVDAPVSIGPSEMEKMVSDINESFNMIGEVYFGVSELEREATVFKRKSL